MMPNTRCVATCLVATVLLMHGMGDGFAADSKERSPFSFETLNVAPGIHVFTDTGRHAVVSGNSVVIIGEDSTLVVDTGHHPELTQRMTAEVRKLTSKPVRYVVNTHWHNDHVAGNSVFASAFPEARFIAHRFTAEALVRIVRPYMGEPCVAFLQEQVRPLRNEVASGLGADGRPISDARRDRLRSFIADADAAIAECRIMRFRGADIAFDDRLTIDLGGRTVQVMWLGRANTGGDAVLYVPDTKTVITGDILVYPFPFATQSYIGEWAAVLRKLEKMDAVTIVPGHGPPMRDKQYLVQVAELMEAIDAQVRRAYRPGATLEEVRKQVDVEPHRKKIAGSDAFLNANFAFMLGSAIDRAYQDVSGTFEPERLTK